MKKLLQIIGIAIVWFAVWAFFILVLEKQGIDYSNHYVITSLYFMLVIAAISAVFRRQIGAYIESFSPKDLLIVSIFSALMALIYFLVNHFIIASSGINLNLLPTSVRMQESFLVSKAFEIMFQQTIFIVSIYYIFDNKVSNWKDIFLFGLFVLLIHIPLLIIPDFMSYIIISVSFFAGIIFSYCITRFKKGFIYSFMVHYGFYVAIGAAYWLLGAKYLSSLI
jgi:hypothetical protein